MSAFLPKKKFHWTCSILQASSIIDHDQDDRDKSKRFNSVYRLQETAIDAEDIEVWTHGSDRLSDGLSRLNLLSLLLF